MADGGSGMADMADGGGGGMADMGDMDRVEVITVSDKYGHEYKIPRFVYRCLSNSKPSLPPGVAPDIDPLLTGYSEYVCKKITNNFSNINNCKGCYPELYLGQDQPIDWFMSGSSYLKYGPMISTAKSFEALIRHKFCETLSDKIVVQIDLKGLDLTNGIKVDSDGNIIGNSLGVMYISNCDGRANMPVSDGNPSDLPTNNRTREAVQTKKNKIIAEQIKKARQDIMHWEQKDLAEELNRLDPQGEYTSSYIDTIEKHGIEPYDRKLSILRDILNIQDGIEINISDNGESKTYFFDMGIEIGVKKDEKEGSIWTEKKKEKLEALGEAEILPYRSEKKGGFSSARSERRESTTFPENMSFSASLNVGGEMILATNQIGLDRVRVMMAPSHLREAGLIEIGKTMEEQPSVMQATSQ